jgi:hypothetical protein
VIIGPSCLLLSIRLFNKLQIPLPAMASRLFTPSTLATRSRILHPTTFRAFQATRLPQRILVPTYRSYSSSGSPNGQTKAEQDEEARRQGKLVWYNIPVGLGIAVVGGVYLYKVVQRERKKDAEVVDESSGAKIRPSGPW